MAKYYKYVTIAEQKCDYIEKSSNVSNQLQTFIVIYPNQAFVKFHSMSKTNREIYTFLKVILNEHIMTNEIFEKKVELFPIFAKSIHFLSMQRKSKNFPFLQIQSTSYSCIGEQFPICDS